MKIPFSFISSVALILAVAIGSSIGGARMEANAQSKPSVYFGTGFSTVPGGSASVSGGSPCSTDVDGVPPIIAGFRAADFGVEATYASSDVEYNCGSSGIVKNEGTFLGVDAVLWQPVGDGSVDLLASAGSYNASSESAAAGLSITYSETDIRLGAGLQFNFSERFALRGLGRYYLGDALDGLAYEIGLLVKF